MRCSGTYALSSCLSLPHSVARWVDTLDANAQVRKLATGYRVKRFKELLPGLDTETLFTDYPKVLMMDLKKVCVRAAWNECSHRPFALFACVMRRVLATATRGVSTRDCA